MIIKLDAATMYHDHYEKLKENEALNQLIISDLFLMMEEKGDPRNFFAIQTHGGEVRYFICNYLPYNMVVLPADPDKEEDAELYGRELAEYLLQEDLTIHGIQSSSAYLKGFREHYPDLEESVRMSIMTSSHIRYFPPEGNVYLATDDDTDVLSEMLKDFNEEALHKEISREEAKNNILNKMNKEDTLFYLYEVDGRILGMTCSTRKLSEGRTLNYVFIDRDCRNRGYGKQMVSTVSRRMLDSGCSYISLFVDRSNPSSNKVYRDIGFEPLLDVDTCTRK